MLNNDNADAIHPTPSKSDNGQVTNRQKRSKFLSIFPSSSRHETNDTIQNSVKWKSTTGSNNNNKAQPVTCATSTSFYRSPTIASSTMTSSSSSSSTVCPSPIPTMTKPQFKVANQTCKPDYAILRKYFSKFQSKIRQRSDILKQQVLPWLRKNTINLRIQSEYKEDACEETGLWGLKSASKEKKDLQFGRSVLLKWWRILLSSMLLIENEERCVYYESILEIISRCEFLDFDYTGPFEYKEWCNINSKVTLIDEYRQLLNTTLKYALDRLNQKAIFSNMISFCAKILALCYFKIPGLASSLLQALKMRPSIMKKLQAEMTNKSAHLNAQYKENLKLVFPPYLHQLMAPDIQSYKHYFADIKTQKIKSPVSLSGNWIRRWKSDDSELFFSFYRHYHSTLKSYVMAVHPIIHRQQLHQRNAILMVSPGYMYFASFFAGKVDSLINREINSVTTVVDQQMATNNVKKNSFLSSTIAPVDNISMIDETKPFMEGYNDYTAAKAHYNTPTGKPKALEMATRRYAECMTWCIVAADPVGLYHDMINVWIRFAIKRTVLTEAEGVYCLLDFIEQTILELQKFPLKRNYFPIDLPFILHTLDIILSRSDHSISLLRALSFIYVHFGFLTSHAALLDLLCNRIMLDTVIFERLLLHWGKNVRIFFLRCLMWRVGRVWHPTGIRWNSEAEQMVKMMVRENKDAAMCDGLSCWSQWINKSNDKLLSQVPNEVKAYRQCSLEIHIVLEALMASFHRNHTYFQNTFTSLPNHKKLDLVTSTTEGSSSLPQTSERTKQFSSQLAVPPIDYNSLPTPFSTYISSGNNYQNFNPNNLIGNSHKRSRPSTNFKKRHMITRSRTGKGRLLKLFNSNVSLLSNNGNIVAEDSSMAGNNVDNEAVNDADTLHLSEFYTVPGNYTVSSILLTEDSKLVQESKLYPLPTIPNTMLGKSLDLNGEQVQCTAPIDDSANLFGHHYQVCELSQMPSPVCLIIQKDLEDIICYSQEVSNEKDLDSSKNDDPPDMLVHARNWKYHPSNHVYASKILSEMKVIMHEYCVWLEKTHESRSSSSMIFVPRLSLDWPKNWTFSHSY